MESRGAKGSERQRERASNVRGTGPGQRGKTPGDQANIAGPSQDGSPGAAANREQQTLAKTWL